jgi:rfaE bifunctional protein nucleotidyltransferase chain/domain
VRRLKGPERPIIPQHDRVDLLLALGCVDAVLVFGEDTPVEALRRFQPDVWVKGGDYAASELPETAVLRTWGGRTVTVPFHPGRSTTRLASALAKVG